MQSRRKLPVVTQQSLQSIQLPFTSYVLRPFRLGVVVLLLSGYLLDMLRVYILFCLIPRRLGCSWTHFAQFGYNIMKFWKCQFDSQYHIVNLYKSQTISISGFFPIIGTISIREYMTFFRSKISSTNIIFDLL